MGWDELFNYNIGFKVKDYDTNVKAKDATKAKKEEVHPFKNKRVTKRS